jgi:hypothetical protein
MIKKLEGMPRFIVCSDTTKRPIFEFISNSVRPDHKLRVFTFADDYSFGVLQSHAHWLWFVTKCSKLKSDFNYTSSTVFDTFPWPQAPSEKQIDAIAAAGREIRRIRRDALANLTGGLRALYRTLDLPGKNPLRDAHAALDTAVLAAYGFSTKADLLEQLLALNSEVARRLSDNHPVTAPGIPATHSRPETLLSDDCLAVDNK